MNSLLNPDNPVMQFITKIVYSVYLNVLWFICCIPVVTAGAATTALYYVTLKMAKNEEGGITKSFFKAFKENFKQSTIVWLILLALGIVLGIDGYVLWHMRFENAFWTIITAIFLVAAAAYLIVVMYIFPLMARFENTIFAMFKNSLFIGMRFQLCTAIVAVIHFALLFVIINFFPPAVILGVGLCAFLSSYFLENILKVCEANDEVVSE